MILNKTICTLFVVTAIFFVGCSRSGGNDDNPPPTVGADPSAATLIFPEDESECFTGVVNPNNTLLSTVTFEWNAAQNADSYTVTVTNLNTNRSSFTNVTTNEAEITIERGTPYSWFVTSRAEETTNTMDSATFRFYNEGPGIENYAPFPAEIVSPARGASLPTTATVMLQWSGSDIDGDLSGYEVFLGTQPTQLISNGTTTIENTIVDVSANTIYYWQVVTTDAVGNTSTSETFVFRVD